MDGIEPWCIDLTVKLINELTYLVPCLNSLQDDDQVAVKRCHDISKYYYYTFNHPKKFGTSMSDIRDARKTVGLQNDKSIENLVSWSHYIWRYTKMLNIKNPIQV